MFHPKFYKKNSAMLKSLILLPFLLILSCHCPDKLSQSTVSASEQTSLCRLNVSFISTGEGTDLEARKAFLDCVSAFEKKQKLKLVYEVVSWGREGEKDYCFRLSELNQAQQKEFIAECRKVLKNSNLVQLDENVEKKGGRM